MASLNMSNDELRDMSKSFRSLADSYRADATKLHTLICCLSANWKGTEFDYMMRCLKKNMEMDMDTVEILIKISHYLSQTADAYEVSEAQLVDDILNNNHLF